MEKKKTIVHNSVIGVFLDKLLIQIESVTPSYDSWMINHLFDEKHSIELLVEQRSSEKAPCATKLPRILVDVLSCDSNKALRKTVNLLPDEVPGSMLKKWTLPVTVSCMAPEEEGGK